MKTFRCLLSIVLMVSLAAGQKVELSTQTKGVLPVARGGLGNNTTPSTGQVPIYDTPSGKYIPGDPIVSGPDAVGAAPSSNPVQGGCRFFTTPATLSNNQVGSLQCDSAENLLVKVTNASLAVTGTFWQSIQPVSGPLTDTQLRASAVPVSGTVTANQGGAPWSVSQSGTWTVQPGNTANSTAWLVTGTGGTFPVTGTFWPTTAAAPGSQRLSDGAAFYDAAKTGQLPTALDGSGFLKTHEQGTATVSGTVTANQGGSPWGVNVSQLNAVTPLMGNGITGTGSLRVTVASDNTAFSVNALQSGTWTDRVVGNAGAAFDAANNAAAPANIVVQGVEVIAIGSQPTAATTGNVRRSLATTEGVMFTQEGSSNKFSCPLQAVTVTTQCQAAPAAGLRAYVTSVHLSNQVATVQTLDVVYGTGSNCATGTTALTDKVQFGTNATTTSPFHVDMTFPTPLIPVAANAICVRPSAATAFGATITGFIAP